MATSQKPKGNEAPEEQKPQLPAAPNAYAGNSMKIVEGSRSLAALESEQFWDALDDMDKENFLALTGEYFKFKKNAEIKIVVTGVTTMKNKYYEKNPTTQPENIEVVSFKARIDGEPKDYITAESVLVSTVKKQEAECKKYNVPAFPMILLVATGDERESKSTGGKYLDMQVSGLYATAPAEEETTA